jgi:hypothetical protein
MAKSIVIGVLGTCDPSQVEHALAATGVNRSQLRVLTSEDPTEAHDNSSIKFVHVAEAMAQNSLADDMTRGTGVLPDFGGTSVPGINDEGFPFDAFSHPEVADYLTGVEIPSGDAEYYNEAIDDGRCVVICMCDGSACEQTKQALQKGGIENVRTF